MIQDSSGIKGVQSVERAIFILDEIQRHQHPITLTELSHKTVMSKSSLRKYLISFVKLGVLTLDEGKKTYKFGYKLIELGLNALNGLDITSIIEPFLLEIREEFNQSSVLAHWTEKGPMITQYQGSGRAINVEVEVGYYPPLLRSSVGKCFAAFLPSSTTKDIFNKEIIESDLDKDVVLEELKYISKNKVASRDTNFNDLPGNHSIASPIFDYSGKVIAVLGIIGFTNELNTDTNSNEVIRLKEITNKISNLLAHQS